MLQSKLAAVETAHQQTHQQLALTERDSQREQQASARTTRICTALQERLLELEAALRQADQQGGSEAAAAVDRLTQRHGEFTASPAQSGPPPRAPLRQAAQQRGFDAAAAVDRLTQRHGEFTASLAQAARSRDTLAHQLNLARAA